MRKKHEHEPGHAVDEVGAGSTPRLTPADIQQKEFRLAFRGYSERDVDEFLDRVTEDLAWYLDESRRLRSLIGGGVADSGPWGTTAEAAAGDVLARAREEADRIVREAEARAAAIGSAGATDHRAIVAPYLNREREFLQGLGGLVQQHAATIKAMVEEARRRTEQRAEAPQASTPEPAPIVITDEATTEPSGSAPSGETDDVADAVETATEATSEEPAVVTSATSEGAGGRVEDEQDPRSLRELFWNED